MAASNVHRTSGQKTLVLLPADCLLQKTFTRNKRDLSLAHITSDTGKFSQR